ncbi:MAG: hypothetical protein WCR08_06055 [Gammaproteobacteria bacterium]
MEQSTSIMRYVAGTAAALLLVITCSVANAEGGPYTQPSDIEAGGAATSQSPLQRMPAVKAAKNGANTEGTSGTSAAPQSETPK